MQWLQDYYSLGLPPNAAQTDEIGNDGVSERRHRRYGKVLVQLE